MGIESDIVWMIKLGDEVYGCVTTNVCYADNI